MAPPAPPVPAVPGVPPGGWDVHRWLLWFTKDGARDRGMDAAFYARRAGDGKASFTRCTALFIAVTLVMIFVDYARLTLTTGGVYNPSAADWRFDAVLVVRLAFVIPLCVALLAFSRFPVFLRRSWPLVVGYALLGACLIVYGVLARNPGYAPLALLFTWGFLFSPVGSWATAGVSAALVFGYGVALKATAADWAGAFTQDAPDGASPVNVRMLNILGTLTAFAVTLAAVGHSVERSERLAFAREATLDTAQAAVKAEASFMGSLLSARCCRRRCCPSSRRART